MNPRQALKQATEALHEALDERLGAFDLGDESEYRAFLKVHGRVLPPFERALEEGGIAELIADWKNHRRAPLIERDLAALAEPMPAPVHVPALEGPPDLLGTAYVIEGSRLGSRYLAKRVGGAMPAEYLNARGHQRAWPAYLSALDEAGFAPADLDRAQAAAQACFAEFLRATDKALGDG
jgi:heme oxygenase (biliverdin-IX-beta and delta-forming)